jgi:hypothetical protein
MGAVYNNEYTKAITYFAVWAALSVMGSRVNGVFGFGAFVFVVFTMFEAYRTAEAHARKRLQAGPVPDEPIHQDKTIIGWGIVLIVLGVLFLLQNIIPYNLFTNLWPLLFILLGGFLVYRAVQNREKQLRNSTGSVPPGPKEDN